MENYETSYARKIALAFDSPISQAQLQLERFEREGVLVSRLIGKTRQYQFNPRYLFKNELKTLLRSALKNLPPNILERYLERYFTERTRPRRKGKPL